MGIFIRPAGKGSFRVLEETWKPNRQTKTVPKEAYPALGFRYDMTLDEAKQRAAQINLQEQLETKKIAEAVRKKVLKGAIDDAYLPEHLVQLFGAELYETYRSIGTH